MTTSGAGNSKDTINGFIVHSPVVAAQLAEEIQGVVEDYDSTRYVRGLDAWDKDAEMLGENIYEDGKTTASTLDKKVTKTINEWVESHAKMGDYANIFTPYAYRMSDVGAHMAAMGMPGARAAAMIGSVIEEDFYLGLGGAPKGSGVDEALEIWFKQKMSLTNIQRVMTAFRNVVSPELLTTEVKGAIVEASKINGDRFDFHNARQVIAKFGWVVGKGKVSAEGQYLAAIAQLEIPEEIQGNVLTKVAQYAAKALHGHINNRPVEDIPRDFYPQEEYPGADNDMEGQEE